MAGKTTKQLADQLAKGLPHTTKPDGTHTFKVGKTPVAEVRVGAKVARLALAKTPKGKTAGKSVTWPYGVTVSEATAPQARKLLEEALATTTKDAPAI